MIEFNTHKPKFSPYLEKLYNSDKPVIIYKVNGGYNLYTDFSKKIIEGYKTLIKTNPERFKVVDATQSIESVISDTYEIILSYLKNL